MFSFHDHHHHCCCCWTLQAFRALIFNCLCFIEYNVNVFIAKIICVWCTFMMESWFNLDLMSCHISSECCYTVLLLILFILMIVYFCESILHTFYCVHVREKIAMLYFFLSYIFEDSWMDTWDSITWSDVTVVIGLDFWHTL